MDQIDTRQVISSLYLRHLGRAPWEHEVQHWLQRLQSSPFDEVHQEIVSLDEYQQRHGVPLGHPPGHFHSPIVDPRQIAPAKLEEPLSPLAERTLGLSLAEMEDFWNSHLPIISGYNFSFEPDEGRRFFLNNPVFSNADAIMLRAMLGIFRPERIIEVGSGFSSAVTLDTIDEFGLDVQSVTFIEPYPDRLHGLLKPHDHSRVTILENQVQDVPAETFAQLQDGDFLFIDSTHVMKTQNDLCYELFEVLPMLNRGVIVHFHDIFYPFEYHVDWLRFSWNEAYALRAFLSYNNHFKVLFFNNMFGKLRPELIRQTCPGYMAAIGGSIWLRKVVGDLA